jgi:hypothetical protein
MARYDHRGADCGNVDTAVDFQNPRVPGRCERIRGGWQSLWTGFGTSETGRLLKADSNAGFAEHSSHVHNASIRRRHAHEPFQHSSSHPETNRKTPGQQQEEYVRTALQSRIGRAWRPVLTCSKEFLEFEMDLNFGLGPKSKPKIQVHGLQAGYG